jgi:hypothetical protein
MFSWVPSIFKRFSTRPHSSRSANGYGKLEPAVVRIGSRIYPCTIVGEISDRTLVTLRKDVFIAAAAPIDIKLDRDRTYRRFRVRWKHGLQVSVQPITAWAAPKMAT